MVDVKKVQELPEFVYDDTIDTEQPEYLRAPALLDIVDFGNMVSRLLRSISLTNEFWPAGTSPIVTPEYPDLTDESLNVPMIVWDVVDRVPLEMDTVPRRRNTNPFREDRESEHILIHNVQRFRNIVEFLCVDRDNYHAYRLQEFLEDFMMTHQGLFQLAGVGKVLYDSRINDRVLSYRERVRDKFAVRTTRYEVFTQVIRAIPITRLQEIEVTLTAGYHVMLNERVTRGSSTCDSLSRSHVLFLKEVKDTIDGPDTYQKDVDYYLSDDKICWKSGGKSPSTGSTYFVTYLYSGTIEFTDAAEPLRF